MWLTFPCHDARSAGCGCCSYAGCCGIFAIAIFPKSRKRSFQPPHLIETEGMLHACEHVPNEGYPLTLHAGSFCRSPQIVPTIYSVT